MALDSRTAILFRLSCDICGARAPEAESRQGALLQAEGEGYRLYSRWTGLDYIYTALCKGCQGLWEGEGQTGDMDRVRAEELSRRYRQEQSLLDLFREPAGQEAR